MSNPFKDPLLLGMGQARLKALLPKAHKLLAERKLISRMESGLPAAMAPYTKEENMEALIVHPGAKGGWLADLVFKKVPVGVSNVIGTPIHRPHATLAEAEEFALNLLSMGLLMEQMVKSGDLKPRPPTFTYYGFSFDLKPELLDMMQGHKHADFGDREGAYARLDEETTRLFPNGVTDEAMQAIPHDQMARLWAVMHRSAMTKVMAFPPRREEAPGKPTSFKLKPGQTIDDVDFS